MRFSDTMQEFEFVLADTAVILGLLAAAGQSEDGRTDELVIGVAEVLARQNDRAVALHTQLAKALKDDIKAEVLGAVAPTAAPIRRVTAI